MFDYGQRSGLLSDKKTEQITPRLHQLAAKQQQGLQNHSDFKTAHPLFFLSRDPDKNREHDDKTTISVRVLLRSRDVRPGRTLAEKRFP
jgi:hypothetical protein